MIETVGAITIHIHKEIEPRKSLNRMIVEKEFMEAVSEIIHFPEYESVFAHFDEIGVELWNDFWQ